MYVNPVEFFERRDFRVDPSLCFVLMPFGEDWSDRTYRLLDEIVSDAGYECKRADDFYGRVVLSDIWNRLNEAAVVIADLTGANPNVYYELGIAHTLGKDIIPTMQRGDTVPFDQQPFRIIFYEDNADGAEVLRAEVAGWLSSLDFSRSPDMLLRREHVDGFNEWISTNPRPILTRLDLQGRRLVGLNLEEAFMSESNLAGADLSRSKMRDTILIRSNLANTNFDACDLRDANLSEARAGGASFRGANLRGAVLIRARLEGTDFERAEVAGCTIDKFTLERYENLFEGALNTEQLVIESG